MANQAAQIQLVNGNVTIIRNGKEMPALKGMALVEGDRLVTGASGRVEIGFEGVKEPMVIEYGTSATLALEAVQDEQSAQWTATDIAGDYIYFAEVSDTPTKTASASDLFGMFPATEDGGSSWLATGGVLLAAGGLAAGLGGSETAAVALVAAAESGDTNNDSGAGGNQSGNPADPGTNPNPSPNPNTNPEAPAFTGVAPIDSRLNGLIANMDGTPLQGPVAAITDTLADNPLAMALAGTSTGVSPMSSGATPSESSVLGGYLPSSNLPTS